jgi:PAS domain S-box-containing protein
VIESNITKNETARLASLHSLKVLDTAAEERFDRITRLASNIFKVPIALISLVDAERVWFKSGRGVEATETPRSNAFCEYTIRGENTFIVPNAIEDSRFADHPLVVGKAGIRFYTGQPLVGPGGHNIGTLCLIDHQPRGFSEEDQEILRDLAAIAQNELSRLDLNQLFLEKQQKEEALQQSQAQLRSVIGNAPLILFTLDQNGVVTLAEGKSLAAINRKPNEVVGLSIYKLYKHIPEIIQAVNRALDGETISNLLEVNGLAFKCWYAPLRNSRTEQPAGVIGVAYDITELKQIERDLRAERDFALQVMNTMGQGLIIVNTQGAFEFVNPAYAAMLDYKPEELIGKTVFDVTRSEDQETLKQALLLRAAGKTSSYETRLQRVDGSTIDVTSTGVPNRRNGEYAGSIAVVTDLTERKRIEENLELARDQAMEASRLKSEFLATVSHEIRTPMTGIIGMSELLLDTPLDHEQREFVTVVYESGQALLTIINDILDLSKIEAGKLLLENTDFKLASVVNSAVEVLTPKARAKNLALYVAIHPAVPTYLYGDAGRLRQVLLNLLSNAIKFTRQGYVSIEVGLDNVCCCDFEVALRFVVSDSGMGIPMTLQQRLFRPFSQADGSNTRHYGGTGLGLVISKKLVTLMGGEIGVQSEEGMGATFWFTARFTPANIPDQIAIKACTCQLPARPPKILADKRLLLVDDDEDCGQLLKLQVSKLGYKLQTATNGQMALKAIIQGRSNYDLILMDCMMPGIDGFMTTHAIRQHEQASGKHIPIIALTANAMPNDREKCLDAGMDDYLSKPVTLPELASMIERWLPLDTLR